MASKPVLRILVEKQPIQSIALLRMSLHHQFPLYLRLPKTFGSGSGWMIDSQTIITNHHVVAGGLALGIEWIDGTILAADIVGRIPDLDIAVLRLEDPLPIKVEWAYDKSPVVGDEVWIGGYRPEGQWEELNGKIISVEEKTILLDERQSFMVIDQPTVPGFSGGAVWNQQGALLGMVTATNENSSFVLPIETILDYVVLQNQNTIQWPELGLVLEGAEIVSVNPYGPASQVQKGTVTALNGIVVDDPLKLQAELRRLTPEQELSMTVDGQRYLLKAQTVDQWNSNGDCSWEGAWLTKEQQGWRVNSVYSGTKLHEMGVLPNDILLLNESCRGLNEITTTRFVELRRESMGFTVIVPAN